MSKEKPSRNQIIDRCMIIFVPIVIAVVIAFIVSRFSGTYFQELLKDYDWASVYSTLLSLFGTLLGFLFAAAAIIFSLHNTDFIKALKDSENYDSVLISYLNSCVHIFLALFIISFLYLMGFDGVRGFISSIVLYRIITIMALDAFITIAIAIFFFGVLILTKE